MLHDPDHCLLTRSGQDPEAQGGEDKREMHLVSVFLPFPICETCLISARLLSTGADTSYKFSPTSPTRTHSHKILNIRQPKVLED
jgi:hypothetical protein